MCFFFKARAKHCATHCRKQRGMYCYRKWQISQWDREISSNCRKNHYRYYLYKYFFCLEFHLVVEEPLGQTSSFIYLHYEKQRAPFPLPVQISTWWNEIMTSKNTRFLKFLVAFNRPFRSCLLPLCRRSLHVKMDRYSTVLNFISIFLFTRMSFL